MKNLARLGCLARSLVYFLIGVSALLVACGSSYGMTTDTRGVLRLILLQPFGLAILPFVGLGLFAYAVWRVVQSVQDRDGYGRGFNGTCIRLGLLLSGIGHGFLGFYAFNLIFNLTRTTAWGERMMARWVLMQPLGRYALELVGAVIVITGTVQFVRAFNGAFLRDLALPARHARTLTWICRFGLVARGVVFVIIGTFFFQAGWKYRSREAGGLHKAWEILQHQPFGSVVLGSVAVGFIAFAVFGFVEGFYRKTV
jgi:hypothetical protein